MRHSKIARNRAAAVQRVRQRLVRESFPRMQMALLVALTGGFGLLASFTLLQIGMESMTVRYPVALSLAYGFFLFLMWLWLRTNAKDYLELPDVTEVLPRGSSSHHCASNATSGGHSSPSDSRSSVVDDATSAPSQADGDGVGWVAGADEFAVPLAIVAFAVGIALASLYVVYIAPILFAEVLVDGALSYALFRHLRGQDPQHWLVSTFRRTLLPFAATAVVLCAVGAGMASYAPGAKSVGQVVKHASERDGTR